MASDSPVRATGRSILLAVAGIVLLLADGLGAVVGAVGAEQARSIDLFGVVVPMTPATMAALGLAVAAGTVAVLFSLVAIASRYDADR